MYVNKPIIKIYCSNHIKTGIYLLFLIKISTIKEVLKCNDIDWQSRGRGFDSHLLHQKPL